MSQIRKSRLHIVIAAVLTCGAGAVVSNAQDSGRYAFDLVVRPNDANPLIIEMELKNDSTEQWLMAWNCLPWTSASHSTALMEAFLVKPGYLPDLKPCSESRILGGDGGDQFPLGPGQSLKGTRDLRGFEGLSSIPKGHDILLLWYFELSVIKTKGGVALPTGRRRSGLVHIKAEQIAAAATRGDLKDEPKRVKEIPR